MDSIELHIEKDKNILSDPLISAQSRRHIKSELEDLESYHENNPEDHHDPTPIELFCDANPSEPECLVYEDWTPHYVKNPEVLHLLQVRLWILW